MSSQLASAHDWTQDLPQTDHVAFLKRVDWAKTALGPMRLWSTALRMYTHMVMSDSRAATLYWGPDRIAIYNASFVPLAAGTHPSSMGQSFAFAFPELVPFIYPMFEEGTRSGVAQDVIEAPMMVRRNGYTEEAFFTGNFTPIRGLDGQIEGFYNALFEVTLQKILDRRTSMLNRIATPGSLNFDDVYSHIVNSLEADPLDIPMAILHEADAETEPGKTMVRLRGQLGMPEGHELLKAVQDLEDSTGLMPLCRQSLHGRVATTPDGRFDRVEWLGFKQPTTTVVTVALTTGVRLFGFLTVGTNPYRPFDKTCEQFIRDLTRLSSSVIASAWDAENLRRKQLQLENKLHFSDTKVRHLVQHASVGMAHATHDGKIIWANDKFFTLADASPLGHNALDSIYDIILPEDRHKVELVWTRIMSGESNSAEVRLKRLFVPPSGESEPAQIQILAFPYKENGVTKSGMACTTEISRLKWAEAWQARIARDAREAKQQQEAFIDVVSHEMRNPLSAIVHCADSISSSLSDIQTTEDISKIPQSFVDALKENGSAASTILDCARHQKRIIDDVLTLSRLESTFLSVKPSAVRPSKVIQSVMDMFEVELRTHAITTNTIADPSIKELGIEYLNLDPSRLTQVFMNLLTNAIKFVMTRKTKKIQVRYGATLTPPRLTTNASTFPDEIHWVPRGKAAADVTDDPEWGTREVVYLTFSLADTGIGMRPNEIGKIFERFRQANVKTHVTYGGSGLGLFIAKELTEKMGGEIGVMSRPGEGSMFAFYIKTRRADKERRMSKDRPLRPLLDVNVNSMPPSARNLRALLVEDNLINQRVLRKHLTKYDCDVEVANHGVEALDILRETKVQFDIVLMDMQMPVMDGLTCMAEIRNLEKEGILTGSLPIIAVTANVRQEQLDAAVAAGADTVMQKPFKATNLVVLMRRLARKSAIIESIKEDGSPGTDSVSDKKTTKGPPLSDTALEGPGKVVYSKQQRPLLFVTEDQRSVSESSESNSVFEPATPIGKTEFREKNVPPTRPAITRHRSAVQQGSTLSRDAEQSSSGEEEADERARRPLMPSRSRTS